MKSTYIYTESIWKYKSEIMSYIGRMCHRLKVLMSFKIKLMKGVKKCTYVVNVYVENGQMPRVQRQWS